MVNLNIKYIVQLDNFSQYTQNQTIIFLIHFTTYIIVTSFPEGIRLK